MKIYSKKNIKTLFSASLIISALFLSACSNDDEIRPDASMVLNVKGSESLIETGKLTSVWETIYIDNSSIFRNLFLSTGKTADDIELDLADACVISEDKLTYEIAIKNDIIWSDGEILDVEDVIFSIESVLLAERSDGIYTSTFSNIVGAKDFINSKADTISGLTYNDNSLIIELEKPSYILLQVLSQFAILPEHILKDEDVLSLNDNNFWFNPVVSGYYTYDNYVVGERVEFTYNDKYVGTPPYINSIVFRSDYSAEELDLYGSHYLGDVLDFRSNNNITEHQINNLFYSYIVFNMNKGGEIDPVMSDIRVRNAIASAIDRNHLIKEHTYNTATLINTGVMEDKDAVVTSIDSEYEYNPELSKELLLEAGYDFARPLTVLFYDNGGYDTDAYLYDIIDDLEDVGFTVELIYKGDLYSEEDDSYDIGINGFTALSVYEWYSEYHSEHPMHKEVFGGEALFDDLLDELNQGIDVEEREPTFAKLQQLEFELLYKLPVFVMNYRVYVNESRLDIPTDTTLRPFNHKYDMNFENWKIN